MSISFCTPFAVSGVLALAAPWAGRRLPPRLASWLLTVAAVVAAGGCAAALAMLALTLIGRIPLVAAVGRWSPGVLAAHTPVAPSIAAVGGLALAGCLVAGTVSACRQARVLLAARRESRGLVAAGDLAVIDDAVPTAFALPGSPGRVVVSSGMLQALDADERRALFAHERAHLRHRHHVFLLLLQVTAAVNPLLRRVASAGSYALERWADEEAAAVVADRRLVARAVARAALAGKHAPGPALAVTGGPVPQRVQALLAPPPRVPRGLVVAHALLMVVCCAGLALSAQDMDQMFDAASPLHTAVTTHQR
ncbi:M56 family metallopeptidase [Streptomyces sp. V4-01]|uniref:M56 family metallopeptidase n=1 Tax=Actinacidiphila polyblastidii TaxID=3110430 RepID=A0ABU7PKT5_9ACTN|nr:M56 family metallopeptidase [Streptomyces sp. V4-01]